MTIYEVTTSNDQKKAYAYGLNLDHLRDQNHFKNQAILEINAKQRESIIHIKNKCYQVVNHLSPKPSKIVLKNPIIRDQNSVTF